MSRDRPLVVSVAIVALASSILAGPVGAATDDALTVTGQSDPTLEIALVDDTAAFGDNLTPQGATPNGADASLGVIVDPAATSTGACYEWGSKIVVSSNVAYDVTVTPAAANAKLNWLTADPSTFAACSGGTAIGTDPIAFVNAGSVGAGNEHSFWLGLEVLWGDAPSATRGDASLTFAVAQDS